jgi:hypothetical protein
MIDMTLLVVAKNLSDLLAFDAQELLQIKYSPMLANVGGRSLAAIANDHLERFPSKVFGLCHADMVFRDGSLQAFYDCAMLGAVCGACGRTTRYRDAEPGRQGCSSYVWSKDWGHPTERQRIAGYPIFNLEHHQAVDREGILRSCFIRTPPACPVSTLDSSCIFFRTDLGLRFDAATFDGFHCHGEDICLQAQSRGIPVFVPAANAWHACADTNGPDWGKERDVYYRRLKAKWPGLDFVTT